MSILIENELISARFVEKGAELISLQHKKSGIEYIWQGDPAFWGRHAPVLFPFVGKLKNDSFYYEEATYQMGQHGFARDMWFQVLSIEKEKVCFSLKSSDETIKRYPFHFELRIIYQLVENSLNVQYQVLNCDTKKMYFSIGGHPAFNVPLVEGEEFEEYYLEFLPRKTRTTIPVEGSFVDHKKRTLAQTNTAMQLSRDFFKNDAYILETKGKNEIRILTDNSTHSITLSYDSLPYVGIWSPYPAKAPFVCIEPWAGISDTVDASGQIQEKLEIQTLPVNESFETNYAITVT